MRKFQKVELKISYLSRILIISALVLISSCSNVGNNITINDDTAEKVLPQESSEPTNNEDQNNIEEIIDDKKGKEIITPANINQLVEVGNLEIDANGITWSPDGTIIAIGNFSKIIIYSSQNLKGLVQINTNASVKGLTFSPDGKKLASAGDSTIYIWDPKNGSELMRIESKSEYVLSLAFSPDGKKIASGGSDGFIRIWDVNNGSELNVFETDDRSIMDLKFSPNGNLLASGGQPSRGNARLWGLVNNNDDYTFDESGTVFSVSFTPDGKKIIFSDGGKINIVDLQNKDDIVTLTGHSGFVYHLSISPASGILASGDEEGNVIFWDINSGQPLNRIKPTHYSNDLSFSPDGKTFVYNSSKNVKFFGIP